MNWKLPHIPYFETSRYKVQTMVDLARVGEGEWAVDLGSGDGRIAIALAQAGAIVTGFETDTKYLDKAQSEIDRLGLSNKITLKNRDFWESGLSEFTVVAIYPMPDIMAPLEIKLQRELKQGSRVLTNYYIFPNWKYIKTQDNVYLYQVGS